MNVTKERIALFTCLPPVHSGIAAYSNNLITLLSKKFEIDVFLEKIPLKSTHAVFHHCEFAYRHLVKPYKVIIYQLGNNEYHDFEYAYIAYYPGIVVLHDPILFHARSRYLIENAKYHEYEEEMRYCHGYSGARLARLAIKKRPIPNLIGFLFPMNRLVIESSIAVGVHTKYYWDQLKFEYSQNRIYYIPMGLGIDDKKIPELKIKSKYKISENEILIGSAGFVEDHKGIAVVLKAIKKAKEKYKLKFVWIGQDNHNRFHDMIQKEGLENECFITGYLNEGEMLAHIKALDILINLRYPTAGEFSAVLLTALLLGKASIMTDLPHFYDIPGDIAMKIDLANEVDSLEKAIDVLIQDKEKRIELGRKAELFAKKNHSLDKMVDAYCEMIEAAKKVDIKNLPHYKRFPRHWQPISTEDLLAGSPEEIKEDWRQIIDQEFLR